MDSLVHMTEHPIFSKLTTLTKCIAELVARNPSTGKAYLNIVRKLSSKEQLNFQHIKGVVNEEVNWSVSHKPNIATNSKEVYQYLLLNCKPIFINLFK